MLKKYRYKDFPKGDARRCFAVLLSAESLQEKATLHFIAKDIECTRAEVQRALKAAEVQFDVKLDREGSRYLIKGWGVLRQDLLLKK